MPDFCTLFDSNYLARGLALYESLKKVSSSFHLYILAFDEKCHRYLVEQKLPHCTVISLAEFEDSELLRVKSTRSAAEYCWTCTPSIIRYCLQTYRLTSCTYLDADMIFYSDPQVLIDEMGEKSVLISEHRYTDMYDQSKLSGIYCVQFMCFKNTAEGLHVLNWWRERCIEWCYARFEDGKFGDQKYLDDWTTRFDSVHVMRNIGGGVAPWNLQQYRFVREGDDIIVHDEKKSIQNRLVFFHFHGVKFFTDDKAMLAGPLYHIDCEIKRLFYFPYLQTLCYIALTIQQRYAGLNPNGAHVPAPSKNKLFRLFLREHVFAFKRHLPSILKVKNLLFKNHYHICGLKHLNC